MHSIRTGEGKPAVGVAAGRTPAAVRSLGGGSILGGRGRRGSLPGRVPAMNRTVAHYPATPSKRGNLYSLMI